MNLRYGLIVVFLFGIQLFGKAQVSKPLEGWHLLDVKDDGYLGISLRKAYEHLPGINGSSIIVAVLDDGLDTSHEDLKDHLWVNKAEIPANGRDDDGNGYIDDVYGWNFIGGVNGRNVIMNLTYEEDLFYHHYKPKYGRENLTKAEMVSEEYLLWKFINDTLSLQQKSVQYTKAILQSRIEKLIPADSLLRYIIKKEEYTRDELSVFVPNESGVGSAKAIVMSLFTQFEREAVSNKQLIAYATAWFRHLEDKLVILERKPKDLRGEIVQDRYYDYNDRFYGNNNIAAGTPLHGTHVAGIIGAGRDNFAGMDGVCENVLLMPIRIVSGGALYSKDLALGIRYAVDNGAKVINISLRQGFPFQQNWIDEAIEYAASKGVLIVHAAGNDGWDLDKRNLYPKPGKGSKGNNWITVGASGDKTLGGIVAPFTNYGKENVNVFAPGVSIYSCIPMLNQYRFENGTSMAAPIVSGLAALIFSYFPNFTAEQVKMIIEESVITPKEEIFKPGTSEKTNFSDLCSSGGIVNAYEAIKLAVSLANKSKD